MPGRLNALQWHGEPGHYEVYYLTLTDGRTGLGVWIRYTMLAPLPSAGHAATAALWLLTMDPRAGRRATLARKGTFPIHELRHRNDPFELRIGDAELSDHGMSGRLQDVAWDLSWRPGERSYEHVAPVVRRAKLAKTMLVLPHPDLTINGTIKLPGETLELVGARGGQAHLWGSKHGGSWAWGHCSDFRTLDGRAEPGAFVDGVSIVIPRLRRELGPATPIVGHIDGRDFRSTSPVRVLANRSIFALTGWEFEAVDGGRKLVGEIDADRERLAGVTYHDPDGELAYCYNSETASMRLHLYERARRVGGWAHRKTLVSGGRAHFEYAQRRPVPDLELLTR